MKLRETSWPQPLPDEAFQGLAGDFVCMVEPHTEADPAALLVQFLVAFGHAVGRGPYFQVEGDRHGMNLYAVIVGATSKSRKGTSWGRVAEVFASVEPPPLDCARGFPASPDDVLKGLRIASGLSSGEGLISHVRDEVPSLDKRRKDDPGVADKRLLVVESEFSSTLKVLERTGNTLSPVIRNAWDGREVLETLTKNSPVRATGAHVSIIGHITMDELNRYMTETETANGFGNRHLWVLARRSKLLPTGGQVPKAQLLDLQTRIAKAVTTARAVSRVTRTKQATELWRELYEELSQDKPALLGAMVARAEAQVMRIASLYALLDGSKWVKVRHLRAAMAVWTYCEESVRAIFGGRTGDPCADKILNALNDARQKGLTRTDIRDVFSKNKTRERIEEALDLLAKHRLAHSVRETTGGRPTERWFYGHQSAQKGRRRR